MKAEEAEVVLKPEDQSIEEEMCSSDLINKNIRSDQDSTSSHFSNDLKNMVVPLQDDAIHLTKMYTNSQNPLIAHNPSMSAISSNFSGEPTSVEGEHIRPNQCLSNHNSTVKHSYVSHLHSTPQPSTTPQFYEIDKVAASFDLKHDVLSKSEDNEMSELFVESKLSLSSNISPNSTTKAVNCCRKEDIDILPDEVASSWTNCNTVVSTIPVGYKRDDSESEDDWPHFPHSPPSPSYASPFTPSNLRVSFLAKKTESVESFITNATKATVSSSTSIEERETNANTPQTGFNNSFLPLHLPYDNRCSYDENIDGVKPSCSYIVSPSKSSFPDRTVPNHISTTSSLSNNIEQNNEHYAPPPLQSSVSKSLPSYSQDLVSQNNPQGSGCSAHQSKRKSGSIRVNGNLFDVQVISSNDKSPCDWLFTDSNSASWSQEKLDDVGVVSGRARALKAEGVDPRRRDGSGSTPAHVAAKKGCVSTLAALLYLGADPDAKDVVGWRPLHYASRYNHSACVALLVARGAYVEARNAAGKSPLHVAAASCAREATRALIAAGANKRARDESDVTPLDVAHSVSVRRERLVGRLSGRFLSKKGFGHWSNWRHLLEKERKIRDMLNNVHRDW